MTKVKTPILAEQKLFIVEAVSTFKIRYAIQASTQEEAENSLKNNELQELSQEWLGETVSTSRETNEKNFLKKEFNEAYNAAWSDEQKLKLINVITK